VTDEHWVEFVRGCGNSLEERINVLESMLAYGYAGSMSVPEWLTLINIHKLLLEVQTAHRVRAVVAEAPLSVELP
jgi:hypothetical protein